MRLDSARYYFWIQLSPSLELNLASIWTIHVLEAAGIKKGQEALTK